MQNDLTLGAKEIFRYKELLGSVVMASMNTTDDYLDKIFPVYEDFVELVEGFGDFDANQLKSFINESLIEYTQQPFFPVLGGLYINALLNKLFRTQDEIDLDMQAFCEKVLDKADEEADYSEAMENDKEVSFSLDFLGYLLPDDKYLVIRGAAGEFCGALMGKGSKLELYGMHGKKFGYERHPESTLIDVEKN